MRRSYGVVLCILLLGAGRAEGSSEKVFDLARSFTVFIARVTTIPFNGRDAGYTTGSGFVIDKKKGLIVTNAHIASEGIGDIKVTFENKDEYDAEVIYIDSKYDFAVLRIDRKQGTMKIGEAKLGDSDKIAPGHPVGTFGNPSSFSFSAAAGIVSATDRTDPNGQFAGEYFQTDAAVSGGNSGGPLIDLKTGNVIGINTWVWVNSRGNQVPGLGFSLKINGVLETLERVQRGKQKPVVGWIGLVVQKLSRQRAEENYGLGAAGTRSDPEQDEYVLVRSTVKESPSEQAGFRGGDLIVSVGDENKVDSFTAVERVLNRSTGMKVPFRILRKTNKQFELTTLSPKVRDRNEDRVSRYLSVSGMALHHITIQFREEYSIPPKGAFVSFVLEGSKGDLAGVQARDIVVGVNGQRVDSIDELAKLLQSESKGRGKVELHVRRFRRFRPDRFLELEVEAPRLGSVTRSR